MKNGMNLTKQSQKQDETFKAEEVFVERNEVSIKRKDSKGEDSLEEAYEMWEKYAPLWKKWAYKMTYVDYEPQDWEQYSFIIFLKAKAHYQPDRGIAFSAYYRMLLYREGHVLMQKDKYLLGYDPWDEKYEQPDQKVDLYQACETKIACEQLIVALEHLEQEEAHFILAYYIHNKSIAQIAKENKCNYKYVEYRKSKALKKLRHLITGGIFGI